MLLFVLLLCVGLLVPASRAQECLCFTASAVNIRDAPCGNVVGAGSTGSCLPSLGGAQSCELSGTIYNFVELEYNGQPGWAADDFLQAGNCPSGDVGVCGNVVRVDRATWGARPPAYTIGALPATPVNNVFIHHTVTSSCFTQADCEAGMRAVQNYHMDVNGWPDIGYNWLVGEDGQAYEGRGWNKVGGHTYGCNSNAVAVSLLGNFHPSAGGTTPNTAIMEAAKNVIDCAIQEGIVVNWSSGLRIFGHRDSSRSANCASTACPGDEAYAIINGWAWYNTGDPGCFC